MVEQCDCCGGEKECPYEWRDKHHICEGCSDKFVYIFRRDRNKVS